jgi:hypothetical protein
MKIRFRSNIASALLWALLCVPAFAADEKTPAEQQKDQKDQNSSAQQQDQQGQAWEQVGRRIDRES